MKRYLAVSRLVIVALLAVVTNIHAGGKQSAAPKASTKKAQNTPAKTEAITEKIEADNTFLAKNEVAQNKGSAKATKIFSIDSIRLLRESKEGKKLETEIQNEIKSFEDSIRKTNSEIVTEQESLSKQASLLNKDALQEKAEALMMKKTEAEKKFVAKRDGLSESFQRRQIKLREKQVSVAREYLEEEGCDLMLEKNAPFILGVSKSIDKTDQVLKVVDNKYQSKGSVSKTTKTEDVFEADEQPSVMVA